jgi:hypothetical protein
MVTEARRRGEAANYVLSAVGRARLAWRLLEASHGLLVVGVLLAGAALAAFAVDNLLHLPGSLRLACGALVAGAAALLLGRSVLWPLLRRITDEMAAAHMERLAPGLENRVINAVLLSAVRCRDPLTRRLTDLHACEVSEHLRANRVRQAGSLRRLVRPGLWALGLAAALAAYGLAFPRHFHNAALRFARPTRHVAPVTRTHLEVRPGNAAVLQGETVAVEAAVSGVLPETADINVRSGNGTRLTETMGLRGSTFSYEFVNVQHSFTYTVVAGDAVTPRYRVTVRDRPVIETLTLTYEYPPYTALPDRRVADVPRDVRVPVGTAVHIALRADRPLRAGRVEVLPLEDAAAGPPDGTRVRLALDGTDRMRGVLTVRHSARFTITIEDRAGVPNVPVVRHLEAVPDAAPRAFLLEPERDVTVDPDTVVTLVAGAEDDLSLRQLLLLVRPPGRTEWTRWQTRALEPGTLSARETWALDLRRFSLQPGDVLSCCARASDGLRRDDPSAGTSVVRHIRVSDAPAPGQPAGLPAPLQQAIAELADRQRANLEATLALAEAVPAPPALPSPADAMSERFSARAAALLAAQEGIRQDAVQLAEAHREGEVARTAAALHEIASGPMARAAESLRALRSARAPDAATRPAEAAAGEQARALARLEELLAGSPALEELVADRADAAGDAAGTEEDLLDGVAAAEKLARALRGFVEEQTEAIEVSRRLAEQPLDDFTDEDEGELRRMADLEREWARFFQEAATDLSKLPPQDHSLATQAKELLEVYSEVQAAYEAAERRAIEMAVPHEQAGLELAESIETNIEKWLTETKDDQRWSMEEPLEDYEVPLVELPDELQDLIGDLIESEEDMLEEFDDITSGWFDSIDLGAGWDAMDGPISNMSAKGVTGNRLPNTQEVGGRSGEGRTGKSSGQFVEQSATGKGGRQTPTRLTPDPFEAGWVDDTSGEAPTGATGGGKVSGQGEQGLIGPLPPPLQQQLNRMASRQTQLVEKARGAVHDLGQYRRPPGRLPAAIELMQAQAESLRAGEVTTFARRQRLLLADLRQVKDVIVRQKSVQRDLTAPLPKDLLDGIAAAEDETVPEQYREMVRNYFRALSEATTPPPEGSR